MTGRKTPGQVADVIERSLQGRTTPQEFNDFIIECHLQISGRCPSTAMRRARRVEPGFETRGDALILLSLGDRQRQPQREAAAIKERARLLSGTPLA